MFAHNCTACSLHCELQSGVTFHADCSSHKLLSGKPLQSRKNHWASPVLIYSCRLEKHQPQWDRCLTKIRAGKMSLPNMPWGGKMHLEIEKCWWNSWAWFRACLRCWPRVSAPRTRSQPGFSLLQGSEQGQEERLGARTALSSTQPAPLSCVAVWLKISKWIPQPLPAGFIISNACDSRSLLCWELLIHCVTSQWSEHASSMCFSSSAGKWDFFLPGTSINCF